MTGYQEPKRIPLSEWLAEVVRATAFPSAGAEFSAENWWSHLVGEAPESKTVQPRIGELKEEGAFEGARLTLKVQPGRIDWTLTPYSSEGKPSEGGLPATLSFEKNFVHLRELMARWFELSPSLDRLAFGAAALFPVQSRLEGYLLLAAYLPAVKLDAEGSSDFIYRINRPRMSKLNIENLRINRLSTWVVMTMQYQQFSLAPHAQPVKTIQGETLFADRVELDINTSPEFGGQLPKQRYPEIFNELQDSANEILEEGDRP